MFTFGSRREKPYCIYRKISEDGVMGPKVDITVDRPTYMHDLCITEHYVIFQELPFVYDPENYNRAFKSLVLESFRQVLTSQGKEQEDAVVSVQENVTLIEKQLEGKKLFGGETIGYLDIAYGWIANLNSVLEIVCDVKVVDADKFPKLLAWMHTFSEVPEIKEFFPPHERLVSKFQAMRKGSLAAGGNK
ncbi:hypothetical protein Leryth_024271 [Lithospermum erythrorhizon]|nr:hypothetical protein Leryth_024271 [Lithospermum erythrorhizon]